MEIKKQAVTAVKLMGLGLIAILCVDMPRAEASGTTRPAVGGNVRPTDVSSSKSKDQSLFPEGQKISLRGSLQAREKGRYRFKSDDSDRSYVVLENSLIEAMAADLAKQPGKKHLITARTTVFDGANYLFVTKLEPAK